MLDDVSGLCGIHPVVHPLRIQQRDLKVLILAPAKMGELPQNFLLIL